jgi:GDP-L-fucose synthase
MPKTSKILITGGSGFVGKNLINKLKASTYTLLIPSSSELNLLDKKQLSSYLKENQPSVIIHLAYILQRGRISLMEEFDNFLTNLNMFNNLVSEVPIHNIKRIVMINSSLLQFHEDSKSGAIGIMPSFDQTKFFYRLSKFLEINLSQSISIPDCQITTLIVPNIYGPYDNFSDNNAHIIPKLMNTIHFAKLSNLPRLVIQGTGLEIGEFLFISDLTDLIVSELSNNDKDNNIINVKPTDVINIRELASLISEKIGFNGEIIFDELDSTKKLLDKNKFNNDPSLLKQESKLINGLKLTYEFYINIIQESHDEL